MKALVLAGGAGTRLRPLTHTSAKQLVPVGNKPVLFYGLEALADAGIDAAGIVVGVDSAAEEIKEAVGDGSKFGLQVTYIPQERPLGLAHAVLIARDYLGDDDFVMWLGDNFIFGGITALVDEFRTNRPAAQILLTKVPDPTQLGVVELDADGKVVGLEEKPKQPKSDLALVGVYMFTPLVHEAVRNIEPSWRGELEITHAISWILESGADVHSTVISGFWKDTGNVNDMLEVNRTVLELMDRRIDGTIGPGCEIIGRVVIEDGADVSGSRIVGPVAIASGTRIVDSYIGPFTSIEHDCRIVDAELEFSIVEHDTSIEGVRRIEASLIGHHVEITPAPRVPDAHRLVLGDHSKVQISA